MRHLRGYLAKTALVCLQLLFLLLLLFTLAFMGLRIWLGSTMGQTYVKQRLANFGIELQSIEVTGFLPTHAELLGVRITRALGHKQVEALSSKIEASWSATRLFWAEVAISELTLSDLRCAFEPSQSLEMPALQEQSATPFLFPRALSIDRFQIKELEILGLGPPRCGKILANAKLKSLAKTLRAHIAIIPSQDKAKLSLLPFQIDLTANAQDAHLSCLLDPEQWVKGVYGSSSDHPLKIQGQCKSDALRRFALDGKKHLPIDIAIDWRAAPSADLELFGIASLGQCLPIEVTAKGELMSKERLDISIPVISVRSALGTADGKGSIDNGQWRDCQLEMQVHQAIKLPKPLKSIPASRSIAQWSGPLDAPAISYSILPFGQRPEDLASEYKLQLKRYRKDPAKWLFDLMLKDRAPKALENAGDLRPAVGLRQVAGGDLLFDFDQGARIELSARGILPHLSPIEQGELEGFFSFQSYLHLAEKKKNAGQVKIGMQGQIGKIAYGSSLLENAHLSCEGQTSLADLSYDWKTLLTRSDSRWQLFCSRAHRGDSRVASLRSEWQQRGNGAQFQISAQNLTWGSLNSGFFEDLSTDGTLQIGLDDKTWSFGLRQIEALVDGNRLKTSQPMHLFGSPKGWELPNLHLQTGDGAVKAHIKSDGLALAADLVAHAVPLSLANSLFDTELQGQLDGSVNLLSCPKEPHLKGHLLTKGAFFFQNGEFRPLDGELDLEIDQKATKLSLSTSFFQQPMLIEGHLPWRGIAQAPFFALAQQGLRELTLSLRGEIGPFASLALPPGQRVKGEVDIALQGSGEGDITALDGAISIRNGEYVYEKARVHLQKITGKICAKDRQMQWDGMTARDGGGGELIWSGRADLWPSFSLQSSAELNKIAYTYADFVKGRISGAMQWISDKRDNHLRGNLKLADAYIEIPDQLPTQMPLIAQGLRQHREIKAPKPSATSLDIDMEIPPRVDISGRGLSSKWGGWLHVGGDSSDAHLEGILKLDSGIFTFGGKQFNIVDSHIYLGDEKRSEPSLQVIAEYPVDGATVRAIFRGRLRSPELSFESYPMLSLNDMLSRVLFDTSFNAINPLQAIQVADAALSISGNRFAPIGQFKRNIKLDQISVQMPDPDEKKFVLQVGKYLKNGVLVGVKQNIDSESSDVLVGTQISLEKRLRKYLTIKIEVGYQSESTLNLLWKRDY